MPSFDLFEQPFVAWPLLTGETLRLGLRGLLERAGDLTWAGAERPQTRVAVIRVLLVLMHQTRPHATNAEWQALWDAGEMPESWLAKISEAAKGRLNLFPDMTREQIEDAFQTRNTPTATALFQSFPPLNDPEKNPDKLLQTISKPPSKLVAEIPAGSNLSHLRPVLDKDVVLCAPCAAAGLLELPAYTYGDSGGYWTSPAGNGPTYALPFGESLWQTLLLNWPLPRLEDPAEDHPSWEGVWGQQPFGMLAAMTWAPKHVVLLPPREGDVKCCFLCGTEGSLFVDGILNDKLEKSVGKAIAAKISALAKARRDPHAIYITTPPKTKRSTPTIRTLTLPGDPSRHPQTWRDVAVELLSGRCEAVTYASTRLDGRVPTYCVAPRASKAKIRCVESFDFIVPPDDERRKILVNELAWLETQMRDPRKTVGSERVVEKMFRALAAGEINDAAVGAWRSSATEFLNGPPQESPPPQEGRDHYRFFNRLAQLGTRQHAMLRQASLRSGTRDPAVFEAFTRAHRSSKPRASRWACYLAALLFAWHPRQSRGLSLSAALRRLPPEEANSLRILLRGATEVTIQDRMLRVVRSLARDAVPLDWSLLLEELNAWKADPNTTSMRWSG